MRLRLEALPAPIGEAAKTYGAFYTDAQIADFLVWWAVRSANDTVLDPSFGGGVFLRSACARLRSLGGDPSRQIVGVEVDPDVHSRIAEKLLDEFALQPDRLLLRDFFEVEPDAMQHTVVVGNPPFIRYQRFSGIGRSLALRRAREQKVTLTQLSSSWAPFLVHCIGMLAPGGRLAMIVPMELAYATYARPLLDHLRTMFGRVTFLTFRKKLFPDLSEDTILLLAEGKLQGPAQFLLRDLMNAGELRQLQVRGALPLASTLTLKAESICRREERLVEYFLPRKVRELYHSLQAERVALKLGMFADVGIGYVTGANRFFHVSELEAELRQLPRHVLRQAIVRGRHLEGLRLTARDWRAQEGNGQYLLDVRTGEPLAESVQRYIQEGELAGVNASYKCRTRAPWFKVPHVYVADAFLSYMAGTAHRLVVNDIDAVAPNSLHLVRLHAPEAVTADTLAVAWQTSLTRLSCEIEGHSLGGGMLKLEPTEAESVCIACPEACATMDPGPLAHEMDTLIRSGQAEDAQTLVDRCLLQDVIGLSKADCDLLRLGAGRLLARRAARGAVA